MKVTSWGLRNPVAINLIMLFTIFMGLYAAFELKRELFPKFVLEVFDLTYPIEGVATPEYLDRTIVQRVYPQIQDIDGIVEITSVATGNMASFSLELARDTSVDTVRDDLETAIERVRDLPDQTLSPTLTLRKHPKKALNIIFYTEGRSLHEIQDYAEELIQELTNKKVLTNYSYMVERKREITVEVPMETLRAKGLTVASIAEQLKGYDLDLSGGEVQSDEGYILLKGTGRNTSVEHIAQTPIYFSNGEHEPLIALTGFTGIRRSFFDNDVILQYNGLPAVFISVEKSPQEDLIDLCNQVKDYLATVTPPEGIAITTNFDASSFIQGRLNLVLKNGIVGLFLVLVVLFIFLDYRVAFWATVGILFALLGACNILYVTDGSLNMLSLYGFAIAIGIVVDDAIVISEEYYTLLQKGRSPKESAIETVRNLWRPVLAMMTTTILAFIPLLFVAGIMGKFIAIIPSVIIAALALSLFESLVILPIHLSTDNTAEHKRHYLQEKVDQVMHYLTRNILRPSVGAALHYKFRSILLFILLIVAVLSLAPLGLLKTSLFPKIDSDFQKMDITFAEGAPQYAVQKGVNTVLHALEEARNDFIKEEGVDPISNYIVHRQRYPRTVSSIYLQLVDSEERTNISADRFSSVWREHIPPIPYISTTHITPLSAGPPTPPVELVLTSDNEEVLEEAARHLAIEMQKLPGIIDLRSDAQGGQLALSLERDLTTGHLPLSERELFFSSMQLYRGMRVGSFFDNNEEVTIYVRGTAADRKSLIHFFEASLPEELHFNQAGTFRIEPEPAEVHRTNNFRSITLSASVDTLHSFSESEVRSDLYTSVIPPFTERFPSIDWRAGGQGKEGAATSQSLVSAFIPSFFAMYAILATLLRSYILPLIVFSAIPMGIIGAIIGHVLLDYSFNLMSFFGVVSLTGIVINDSLVLVFSVNTLLEQGVPLRRALVQATERRFRPILLTSLTTMISMFPILFETSFQAQFLVPMALSIVSGLFFSTFWIVLFIPPIYAAFYMLQSIFRRQPKLA